MRIALTGATGFIGRPLAHRLAEAGHDLVLLTRRPHALRDLPPRAEVARFDASEPLPAENLKGAEVVIHLAGENVSRRWTAEMKERIQASRVKGTAAVAAAVREAGTVKALLCASGINFYGPRGDELVTEETPPGDDFLATVCQRWEAAALEAKAPQTRVALFRMGLVLHPDGGALARMLLPFNLGLGGPMGSGDQYLPFIHLDDALRILETAVSDDRFEGPFNVVAPSPITNRVFAKALGRALYRPAVLPLPGFALRALFGEMADALLTGQRAVPARLEALGFSFHYPDLRTTLKDLVRS